MKNAAIYKDSPLKVYKVFDTHSSDRFEKKLNELSLEGYVVDKITVTAMENTDSYFRYSVIAYKVIQPNGNR